MTHPRNILVLGACATKYGILISRRTVMQLAQMGVVIRTDEEPFGGNGITDMVVDELFGMPVTLNRYLREGEIWFQKDGQTVGRVVNDEPQPGMTSPFFNDLAG